MLNTNTNNYVESWNSNLKINYLGSQRKQRPDVLVSKLLNEVLPDLQLKDLKVSTGFIRRRMTDCESNQFEKCMNIPLEAAESYVHISTEERRGQGDPSDVVTVRSFKNLQISYKLSFTNTGLVSGCSCPFMTSNLVVCKHMFMAQRMCGYMIDFDTRHWDKSAGTQVSSAPTKEAQEERGRVTEIAERLHQMIDTVVGKTTNLHNLTLFEEGVKHAMRQAFTADDPWTKKQGR